MKQMFAVIMVAGLFSFSAMGQYRMVRGQVYARNAPEWTIIRDLLEVKSVEGRNLVCIAYTEHDNMTTQGGGGNMQFNTIHHVIKEYHDTYVITNYPSANRFARGDIIRGPISVMKVDATYVLHADTTRAYKTTQDGSATVNQVKRRRPSAAVSGTTHETTTTSYSGAGGILYDYGTDYTPPAKVLTKEQAAAARAKAAKSGDAKPADAAADATFKFHLARAKDGNAGSQFRIGQLYLEGKGCTCNTNEAKLWLEKAAGQGNEDAKELLKTLD